MLENLSHNQSEWEKLVEIEIAETVGFDTMDADMADDELDTCSGTNVSDSAELLLPLRRSSLNPPKQVDLREQWRRFSVQLNMFQDCKIKNRDKTNKSSMADSESHRSGGSADSLHSDRFDRGKFIIEEMVLSKEKLLPDSSIAFITTPRQATRLSNVLNESGGLRLFRQQTFPPLEGTATQPAYNPRRRHTASNHPHYSEISKLRQETALSNMFKNKYIDKTDNDDASENNNIDLTECSRNLEKENLDPLITRYTQNRRESAPVGSQLRDNLTSVHVNALANEQLLRRRKSMPTDTLNYG